MPRGLVEPKSGNVEKVLVLPLLFEGSRVPRIDSEKKRASEPGHFGIEKVSFSIKNASRQY